MSWKLFWWIVTGACVVWYSTITIYVTIMGASDIKEMLSHLAEMKKETPPPPAS